MKIYGIFKYTRVSEKPGAEVCIEPLLDELYNDRNSANKRRKELCAQANEDALAYATCELEVKVDHPPITTPEDEDGFYVTISQEGSCILYHKDFRFIPLARGTVSPGDFRAALEWAEKVKKRNG